MNYAAVDMDTEGIIDAVIANGQDQWYDIALKLGCTDAFVTSCTADKPRASSKLRVILEKKRSEVGDQEIGRLLLDVCRSIPHPIIGVILEAKKLSGSK